MKPRNIVPIALLLTFAAPPACMTARTPSPVSPAPPDEAAGGKGPAVPTDGSGALAYVARVYYEQVKSFNASMETQNRHDTTAIWTPPATVPATACGRVTGRKGFPVAGATIEVELEARNEVIGRGITDADGRFIVPLDRTSYRGLTLVVTRDGFERWACGGLYGGITLYPVRLDRTVDLPLLDRTCTDPSREDTWWSLLEIIGARQMGLSDDDNGTVFRRLGALRPRLLEVIRSGALDSPDDRGISPADRCRGWLALWCDPEDSDLLTPADHKAFQPSAGAADAGLTAPTVPDLCERWKERYWSADISEKRAPCGFDNPVLDETGTRALAIFWVRYAHWGYSLRLVLVKTDGLWSVRREQQYKHFDFDR